MTENTWMTEEMGDTQVVDDREHIDDSRDG